MILVYGSGEVSAGELAIAGIEYSGKHTVVGRAFNNNEDCSNHSELVVKFGIVNECYLCCFEVGFGNFSRGWTGGGKT